MARDSQSGAKATAIEPGLIARIVQGVRYGATGKIPDAWFGPQNPMDPVVSPGQIEQVTGRQFDYPVAFNTRTTPRGEEAISFAQLRQFADTYDLLRLVIETRKDEVARLPWSIKSKDDSAPDSADADIAQLFRFPDREHTWDEWIRILLEDMLVIDAATIYPRQTNGGQLYALEPVDGSTIKRVIDEYGRTPMVPEPAYQQILHGVPARNYTREELIYRPRNPRSHKIYGYSPVEQIIISVQIALRRQAHTMEYFTSGSVPDVFIGVPKEWAPDQIRQMQEYWDMLVSGDSAERRRARFIPDMKITPTKEPSLKDQFDDWLARIVCYAFSVDISTLVAQQNRATAETQRESSEGAGLAPAKLWIKAMMDHIIANYIKRPDKEFHWEAEPSLSPSEQAQIHKTYVEAKVLTPDEVRAELGLEPLTPEQRAEITQLAPKPSTLFGDKSAIAKKKSVIERTRGAHTKEVRDATQTIVRFLSKSAKDIAQALGDTHTDHHTPHDRVAAVDWHAWGEDLKKPMAAILAGVYAKVAHQEYAHAISKKSQKSQKSQGLNKREEQSDDLGIALDISEKIRERATQWAESHTADLVKVDGDESIVTATQAGIESLVTKSLKEGWSSQKLADEIEESYGFSEERSVKIAVTEMARADSMGTLDGWKESGVVTTKFWSTVGDDMVEEECEANEAQGYIPLDEEFQSGDEGPPSHPNCRCGLLAGLDTDETE